MGSMSSEMKKFIEVAAKKWFTQAWKDKVAGAFTNSSSFSGDKLNTLLGLVINAMQHGMIYVGLGMMPAASDRDSMNSVTGRVEWPIVKIGFPKRRRLIVSIATWHREFSCSSSVESRLMNHTSKGRR